MKSLSKSYFSLLVNLEATKYEVFSEGGVRVCGDVVLCYFWCGFAESFILTCGIAMVEKGVCGEDTA